MISIKIPELEDGFLDEEAKSYIPEKFRDLYEFALIINRRIYKSYHEKGLKIINQKYDRVLIGFWGEMHKNYQAIIVLTQMGLSENAVTLLRRLYEFYFKLIAIKKQPGDIKQIDNDYLYQLCKVKNKVQNNEEGMKIYVERNIDLSEIKSGYKKRNIDEWAHCADMEAEYNLVYDILCEKTHAGLSSIFNNFVLEDKKIEISFVQEYKDFYLIITEAIRIMFELIEILEEKFNLREFENDKKELIDKLESFESILIDENK